LVDMGKKEEKEREVRVVEGVSLLSTGRSVKKGLQTSAKVVEEGEAAEAGITEGGVSNTNVFGFHR